MKWKGLLELQTKGDLEWGVRTLNRGTKIINGLPPHHITLQYGLTQWILLWKLLHIMHVYIYIYIYILWNIGSIDASLITIIIDRACPCDESFNRTLALERAAICLQIIEISHTYPAFSLLFFVLKNIA